MAKVADRLDTIVDKIMSGLKDFQQATVERIDYLYRHNQRRVLVSDEVGLGKTLIARGTVAKLAKLRRERETTWSRSSISALMRRLPIRICESYESHMS